MHNNGIARWPKMHRALISVSNDCKIIISPQVFEDDSHSYGLKQLVGKDILLPSNEIHYPVVDSLIWHRENVYKG